MIRSSLFALVPILSAAASISVVSGDGEGGGLRTAQQDSVKFHKRAKEEQAKFESYRGSRIPPAWSTQVVRCDEVVGRFCLRHEGGSTDPIPQEPIETGMARRQLIRTLSSIAANIPGDHWILGQRVFYLREDGQRSAAMQLVRRCESAQPWWCETLEGYLLHHEGKTVESMAAFDLAMAEMPPGEARLFLSPEYTLDDDGRKLFADTPEEKRGTLRSRLWLLSDPLYLVESNDRLTAHYARRTLVLMREESTTAYGLDWDEDLAELVMRYGGEIGWERARNLGGAMQGRDTRQVIGRHHPKARDYIPRGAYLADPAKSPPGAWKIEDPKPLTGYAAPYALDMAGLDAQVGRFRRGDSLLVVAAYEPTKARRELEIARRGAGRANPFGPPPPRPFGEEPPQPTGEIESGFFLLTDDGAIRHEERGDTSSDVVTAQLPNGEYLLGLEVWEPEENRAWRIRQGIRQRDVVPGLAALSDMLFLKGGEPPKTLEEGLSRVLPSTRVKAGDAVTVIWEVYGLRPNEFARVTLGFAEGEPTFLRRLGQLLRVIEPDEPIEISFEDAAPDRWGTVFRGVHVDIPSLQPGTYTLHLEVTLRGRDPMVTERRLVVEPR